jgi:hypothetical protein
MSTRTSIVLRNPRRAQLAASLAAVLGLTVSAAQADNVLPAGISTAAVRLLSTAAVPPRSAKSIQPSTPHVVSTCADDGDPGSLRGVIDSANTVSGDTIDMSSLMCSTIMLDPNKGEIVIPQSYLYLEGPGSHLLTIDADNLSRALHHTGVGKLSLSDITIANGAVDSTTFPYGGCIHSTGSVTLFQSAVSHCVLTSSSNAIAALGGGVYAHGVLTLNRSTITGSSAFAGQGPNAVGGGAYAYGGFNAYYSEISGNSAFASGGGLGYDGGVSVFGTVNIESSTISENTAQIAGGLGLRGGGVDAASITNSTISSNIGAKYYGGIFSDMPLTVDSSTIAFNRVPSGPGNSGHGLFIEAQPLTLRNTIISGNSGHNAGYDLAGTAPYNLTGSNNLITSSGLPPLADTIHTCPGLQPLANNGGATRTHALSHLSPAIDQGDAGNLIFDQRGAQRTVGAAADIGSVEWQPGETDERVFVHGFDGLCDQ